MKFIKVIRTADNKILAHKVRVADSFLQRFRGLMFSPPLKANEGLLIEPCSSIHMMFMRFAIDAVFLDASNKVKKVYSNLQPWLGLAFASGATKVIELKNGTVDACNLKSGDLLLFEKT